MCKRRIGGDSRLMHYPRLPLYECYEIPTPPCLAKFGPVRYHSYVLPNSFKLRGVATVLADPSRACEETCYSVDGGITIFRTLMSDCHNATIFRVSAVSRLVAGVRTIATSDVWFGSSLRSDDNKLAAAMPTRAIQPPSHPCVMMAKRPAPTSTMVLYSYINPKKNALR